MTRAALSAVVISALAATAAAQQTATPGRARVVLTTPAAAYTLGEDPEIQFCVENLSAAQAIGVDHGGDYRAATRAQRFKITAIDAAGRTMPDPEPSGFHFGGMSGVQNIPAGGRWCEPIKLMRYVRIDEAGTYTIRATHDLGWPAGQAPAGSMALTFTMPSPAEAERLTAAFDPYFGTLRYAVYLEPLLGRVRAGNAKAIDGIAVIPTPAATRALVDLTSVSDKTQALAAAQALAMRLPDPQLTGGLPLRSPFAGMDAAAAHTYLRDASWRAEFAPDVRAAGRRLLAESDTEAVITGAFLIETVGETTDGAALSAALTHAIDLTRTMPFDAASYPRPRGAAAELMRAAQIIASRGYVPPANDTSAGAVVLRAVAIGQGARPSNWEQVMAGAFAHETPYVREVAMDQMPADVPASLVDVIGANVDHPDIDVAIAACRLVTRAKLIELTARVTAVAERAKEQWLRNAADNAVFALSGRGAVFAIRARKLADPEIAGRVLGELIGVFGVNGWRSTEITADQARDLSRQWIAFVDAHRAEIDAKVTVELDAPDVPRTLVPPGWVLQRKGKPDWPPGR